MINLTLKDIDNINFEQLGLDYDYLFLLKLIKGQIDKDEEITDELLSWIINPPPIFMAKESDEMEELKKREIERYTDNKRTSLKIVDLVKKEFYDFLCTESEYYEKERTSLGTNANALITGISSAIATKLTSIEVGIIISFVTTFIIVAVKMGKNAACKLLKQKQE